jgi:hypothetical protein
MKNCSNFEDENLSHKFSAEMEFCKIDPRTERQAATTRRSSPGWSRRHTSSGPGVDFANLHFRRNFLLLGKMKL